MVNNKKLPKYELGVNQLNLMSSAGNILGGGIQQLDARDGQTTAGGQIGGGALKGAGTGAAIGSIIPGIGTAIGAGVGAVIGGIGGGIKNKQAQTQQAELQAQQDTANLNGRKSMFTSNLEPTMSNIPTFADGVKLPKYYNGSNAIQNPDITSNGLGVYDPAILPEQPVEQEQINLFEKNLPYIAGQTALTTIGNLALANKYGKPTPTEDITTTPIRAPRVDFGNSRRELSRQANLAKRGAIRQSSGLSGGARQSNLAATNIGLNRNLGSALAQSYENQANQNVNLQFQADRVNAAQNLSAEQTNVGARNLALREAQARKLGLTTSALGGLQQGFGDIRNTLTQDEILNAEALRTPYYYKKDGTLGIRRY